MGLRLKHACLGALVAACALAGPAAHAFSLQDKDSSGPTTVPKFDLDEQMRHYKSSGADLSATDKKGVEVPFGNGTFHIDAQQGSVSNFISPGLSGMGPAPRNTREDFNRVVTPDSLR